MYDVGVVVGRQMPDAVGGRRRSASIEHNRIGLRGDSEVKAGGIVAVVAVNHLAPAAAQGEGAGGGQGRQGRAVEKSRISGVIILPANGKHQVGQAHKGVGVVGMCGVDGAHQPEIAARGGWTKLNHAVAATENGSAVRVHEGFPLLGHALIVNRGNFYRIHQLEAVTAGFLDGQDAEFGRNHGHSRPFQTGGGSRSSLSWADAGGCGHPDILKHIQTKQDHLARRGKFQLQAAVDDGKALVALTEIDMPVFGGLVDADQFEFLRRNTKSVQFVGDKIPAAGFQVGPAGGDGVAVGLVGLAVALIEHHMPAGVLGSETTPCCGAAQVVLPGLIEGLFLVLVANFTRVVARC